MKARAFVPLSTSDSLGGQRGRSAALVENTSRFSMGGLPRYEIRRVDGAFPSTISAGSAARFPPCVRHSMTLEIVSSNKSYGGWHKRYRHRSSALNCDMVFAVYLPPQAEQGVRLPVLYWLSGLTCTDENFMQKAGAQKLAAELGLIIVAPDTSPRGEGVPDDPDKAWDFGLGAGFYLNATQEPW